MEIVTGGRDISVTTAVSSSQPGIGAEEYSRQRDWK